ncbi:MAG: HEPN domain-containing protein [Anaerolineae bacterium]
MTDKENARRREVELYIQHAQSMLKVAQRNLEDAFYDSAVNRAYYAVFYATSALLATEQATPGKHSGVISLFRQHFIKTGRIEDEYSRIYGRLMDDRHVADYEVDEAIEADRAQADLNDAQQFVARIVAYLGQEGLL